MSSELILVESLLNSPEKGTVGIISNKYYLNRNIYIVIIIRIIIKIGNECGDGR